ncbi:hypothetical protein QBC42DRAFT_347278 [Cladorrhinum samala]|uniref:Rhodopsin domain-containing protein n=1 Tax=Cladorrhinum samala TaxID=585594 RepID=A0AAV9HKP6_9PEZI|nr:hypothetical protein QBC42DRAFT_347278 [Cladorrhinum samala]
MASSTQADMPPDHNRGPEILATCGSLVAISLLVVSLRMWVRAKMIGTVGADDWTIVAAMVTMFVEMMIIIPEVGYGAGRHVHYIDPPENVIKGLHFNFITQPLCLIGLCLTKVSVGLFLLRLTTSNKFRKFIIGMIIFTVLSASGNFLTVFFQCRPLAFIWDSTIEGGVCIPATHLKFAAFFNSSVAVLTDVIFALLPIPMLWDVQMNWRVKSAIAAILSLGIFAAVSAIVKITFLSSYGKHGDFLFDSSDITIWTTVEICTAIIAASFPCLKPLFKTLFDGTSARRGAQSGGYGSRYKGYVRDTTGDHGAGNKSNITTVKGGDGGNTQFEMYSRTGGGGKFAAEPKSLARTSSSGSEESILGPHSGNLSGGLDTVGIVKTTSVFVSSVRDGDIESGRRVE